MIQTLLFLCKLCCAFNKVISTSLLTISFKDGVKISESSHYFQIIREHSDKGFYELVIPNVKPEDAGIYKCVASNKFGEASSEATVTVTGKLLVHVTVYSSFIKTICRYKEPFRRSTGE